MNLIIFCKKIISIKHNFLMEIVLNPADCQECFVLYQKFITARPRVPPPQTTLFCIKFWGMDYFAVFQATMLILQLPVYIQNMLRCAKFQLDWRHYIFDIFLFTFLFKILLNKMSKSSFFYQAETFHSCAKFKKVWAAKVLALQLQA